MGVIETEEAAKRLARVIVSDIEIYNKDKFHTGADLTNAIEEGRALFRSRVAPELLPLFTVVLEDRRANRRKAEAEPSAALRRSVEPVPAAQPVKPAPRAVEKVAEPIVQAAPPAVEAPAPVTPAPAPAAPIIAEAPAPAPAAAPIIAEAPAPAPAAATPAPASAAPAAAPAARSPSARGGIIDTEEAAARLARVIISDIELYNAKKIAAGLDLTSEIAEGRALFKSRVSGELITVFETALANKNLGPRRRAPTPAPVPKARPPVVETPQPVPVAAAAPSRPAAAAPMRPQVSAVNAPPAPQPRPGLAPAARPAGTPHAVSDAPSARHQIAASAAPATPAPVADRGSARHAAPPPGRVAPASRTPDLTRDDEDMPTPMPGMHDDIAAEAISTPSAASAPAAPRMSAPRLPATPPPVPIRASAPAMRAVGATPSSPQRTRTPSVPEFAIHVESGPIRRDEPPAGRPSQAVIDALPDSGPVFAPPAPAPLPPPAAAPPLAVAPAAPAAEPAPAAPPARAPRAPTPAAVPAAPPIAFAPVPTEAEEPGVSLRRRVSPARVILTLVALAGAGGAIWYFLLR